MNIFVQYVQQDVGLRVRIIPVGDLVEKLGMAFRDVSVISLPALYKFQIGKTETLSGNPRYLSPEDKSHQCR